MINPTIGVEIGQSYTFVQADISNWMHPMGFAYFPDGAHDDKDELEPANNADGLDLELRRRFLLSHSSLLSRRRIPGR